MKITVQTGTGKTLCLDVGKTDSIDSINFKVQNKRMDDFSVSINTVEGDSMSIRVDPTDSEIINPSASPKIPSLPPPPLPQERQRQLSSTASQRTSLPNVEANQVQDRQLQQQQGRRPLSTSSVHSLSTTNSSSVLTQDDQGSNTSILVPESLLAPDYINLTVLTIMGKKISIKVQSGSSVQNLHLKIQEIEGIPIAEQRLIFQGKQLDYNKRLSDYGIKEGGTVHLMLRLRG